MTRAEERKFAYGVVRGLYTLILPDAQLGEQVKKTITDVIEAYSLTSRYERTWSLVRDEG